MKKNLLISFLCSLLFSSVYAGPIQFSYKIPDYQREILENDLLKFQDMNLVNTDYDYQLMDIMQVQDLSNETLLSWLYERVGYVVSEDFNRDSDFIDIDEWFSFPNPFDIPAIDDSEVTPIDPNKKMYVVMANIGVAQYLVSKVKRDLMGFNFLGEDGEVVIPLVSPRLGLIQIGEGLFHEKLLINKEDINAESNSIMRLITLFHEARHSDGNATTLGFFHGVCPVGHKYQGKSVCDKNLNGPYAIDGLLTLKLIQSCLTCSVDEKAKLEDRAMDSLNRVLSEYVTTDYTDEVKKQILDLEEYLMNLKGQWNSEYLSPKQEMMISNAIDSTQSRLDRLLKTGETVEKVVPTTHWDASPEFKR